MKKLEEFIDILAEHDSEDNIFPPSVDTQFAFDCLTEALLGSDYVTPLPCNTKQINTIILDKILMKYSKEYRKLVKKKQKELRNNE